MPASPCMGDLDTGPQISLWTDLALDRSSTGSLMHVTEHLRLAAHPDMESRMRPSSDSQHARILVAINAIAGRKGVSKTTVADVVKEAGVSRTTFYELFRSKDDCFIESFVYSTDLLREITRSAVTPELSDWRIALRRGVQAHLGALASSPEFARANLIEIQNVGDVGHARRNEIITKFALAYQRLFEIAVEQEPDNVVPSPEALFSLVAGLDQLQCVFIRQGRIAQLPTLEDTLFDFSSSVFLGAAHAGKQTLGD